MTTIAIDLDEVLAEMTDAFLAYYEYQINNVPFTKPDIKEYGLRKNTQLGITQEQAIQLFHKFFLSPGMKHIQPVDGAAERLQQRKATGHQLYIITARMDKFAEDTRNRVAQYFWTYIEDIYFANHYHETAVPKSSLCRYVGATIMIEDHLDYATELTANGIQTYLLDKPRNQQYDPLIHTWIKKVDHRGNITLE